MSFTNGQTITAAGVNGIFEGALNTVRTYTQYNYPYKQWQQSFRVDNLTDTTPEYLRTISFYPRTDCIIRAIRIDCSSSLSGLTATATIPAQVLQDNVIVGGNIKNDITLSATSNTAAPWHQHTGLYVLPNEDLFTVLAGDSIDIIVSTDADGSTGSHNVDVAIVLTLENRMESK
jgi:hypothetical protein